MMACSYYKWNFAEFLKTVLPYTVHLHVVDAQGVDGEGVQIGEGDGDFNLRRRNWISMHREVQFIPEVWQGHKNRAAGFGKRLNFGTGRDLMQGAGRPKKRLRISLGVVNESLSEYCRGENFWFA